MNYQIKSEKDISPRISSIKNLWIFWISESDGEAVPRTIKCVGGKIILNWIIQSCRSFCWLKLFHFALHSSKNLDKNRKALLSLE